MQETQRLFPQGTLFKDSQVNWSNWRQFNSLEKEPKIEKRYLMNLLKRPNI